MNTYYDRMAESTTDEKMIIALGTGRCGSVSFADTFNTFHEFKLPGAKFVWREPPTDLEFKRFSDTNRAWANKYKKQPGDASMGQIWALDRWIDEGAEIWLLMRDREETLRSFRTHKTKGLYWNNLFPEFDFKEDDEIRRYWDWYYETALEHEKHLRVIAPEHLPVKLNKSIIKTDKDQ